MRANDRNFCGLQNVPEVALWMLWQVAAQNADGHIHCGRRYRSRVMLVWRCAKQLTSELTWMSCVQMAEVGGGLTARGGAQCVGRYRVNAQSACDSAARHQLRDLQRKAIASFPRVLLKQCQLSRNRNGRRRDERRLVSFSDVSGGIRQDAMMQFEIVSQCFADDDNSGLTQIDGMEPDLVLLDVGPRATHFSECATAQSRVVL
jgi:hypothetical protein